MTRGEHLTEMFLEGIYMAWTDYGSCKISSVYYWIIVKKRGSLAGWHAQVNTWGYQIHLIWLSTNLAKVHLVETITATSKGLRAFSTTHASWSFYNLEDGLRLWLWLQLVRVVNQVGVQLLQLVKLNESPLISESFLGQVFPTLVSNKALAALPALFLLPILEHFVISFLSGK